jgi:hypothetical protein
VIWVLPAGFFSSGLLLRKMILIGANKDKQRLDTTSMDLENKRPILGFAP